jgi:hypothetical protein
MPYIMQERRDELKQGDKMQVAGELNYALTLLLIDVEMTQTRFVMAATKLIERYLSENSMNYQTINDIIGAILGSLLEFQNRRGTTSNKESALLQIMRDFYKEVAVPYEKIKASQNGDVY